MGDKRTRIKLCGLMCEADVRAAVRLQPDYIGFILSSAFRRYADPEAVKVWRSHVFDDTVTAQVVGVFVNEDIGYVARQLHEGVIDIAQLHGQEDERYIRQLQEVTDKKVIKAFKVREKADVLRAAESPADFILLDAGTGEGQRFNWELAIDVGRDFFLAGGLAPENVAEAIRLVRPFAVDVSSGTETDGKKDPVRMEAFVQAVLAEEND